LIFVHEQSDALTGLVKKIDERLATAGKYPRRLGVFVLFVKSADGLDKDLLKLAEKEGLQHVSLCIGAPPKDYKLAEEADITVVIYTVGRRTKQSVTANFALRRGELNEARTEAIVNALSEVLPK
jgi:hypothetical protein